MKKEAFALNKHVTENKDITFHLYKGYFDSDNDFYYAERITQCNNSNVEFHSRANETHKTKKMRTRLAEIQNDNEKEICANCVRALYIND